MNKIATLITAKPNCLRANFVSALAKAFAIVALTACTQRDLLDEAQRSTPVTFSVAEIETRAGDTYVTGAEDIPTGKSFGVLGYVGASCTGTPGFLDNVAVTKTVGGYTYNTRYWPLEDTNLSFAAYYPHNAGSLNTTDAPSITFTVQGTPATQVDLMYAAPLEDKSKGSALSFTFKHALVPITFKAKLSAAGTATITKIELTGVANQGTLSLANGTSGTWSGQSTTDTGAPTYTLDGLNVVISSTTTPTDISTTTPTDISTDEDDILLMIPQTLGSTAKITVTYTQGGADKFKEYNITGEWKANTPVSYTFII